MRRKFSLIPILILLPAAIPSSLRAQAVLVGRTLNDSTKEPISGAEVVVEKLSLKVESDRDGKFTLPNLAWGVQTAVIRKIGYRPVRLQLMVASDDTVRLDIRLRNAVVELPPLEVTASNVPVGMEDFARRRLTGFGRFIDAKELRQSDHRRLSDLFTGMLGVRTVSSGFRTVLVSSRSHCPMAIWLDGMQIFSPGFRRPAVDINEFSPIQLEGIEVYAGPTETPPELSGSGAACGAVALWTRRS